MPSFENCVDSDQLSMKNFSQWFRTYFFQKKFTADKQRPITIAQSNMSAHVLLNEYKELGKRDKIRGYAKHFIDFWLQV